MDLSIFVRAIPYNFYAILTIVMMVGMVLLKIDYGPMKMHEKNAVTMVIFIQQKTDHMQRQQKM